jgi:hypothetical protein
LSLRFAIPVCEVYRVLYFPSEVFMSGRRSHPRLVVIPAAEGHLRLLRDVVVQHIEGGEAIAISRDPGTIGEMLVLELPMDDKVARLHVRVIESRPLIVEGNVRHRLQLEVIIDTPHPIPPTVQPTAER